MNLSCKFCGNKFLNKKTLYLHHKNAKYCKKIRDEDNFIYSCEYCDTCFDDIDLLDEHNETCKINIIELEKQKTEIMKKMLDELVRQRVEEEIKQKEEEDKKKLDENNEKDKKRKKQPIPKNVRNIVWNHYIGEDVIKHKCLCCKKVSISNTSFDVGHVISEKNGGTHEINNLRPICCACNHSMGTENMIDFVVKFGLYIG